MSSSSSTSAPSRVIKAREARIRALQEEALALQLGRENPLIEAMKDTLTASGQDCFKDAFAWEALERRLELYIQKRGGTLPSPYRN